MLQQSIVVNINTIVSESVPRSTAAHCSAHTRSAVLVLMRRIQKILQSQVRHDNQPSSSASVGFSHKQYSNNDRSLLKKKKHVDCYPFDVPMSKLVYSTVDRKCKFQKFWKRFPGPTEILLWSRKSGPVTSILPKCCGRSRTSGHGVIQIITKESACSRNSGSCVLIENKRKCKFQKFWKRFPGLTEILLWSRNCGLKCCGRFRHSGNCVLAVRRNNQRDKRMRRWQR
jgi:hypothetical protein